MIRTFSLCLLAWNCTFLCQAQTRVSVHGVLQRIAAQQVKSDAYFMQGIFPSYFSHKQRFSAKKGNNNIFYNGLIGYTLKSLRPSLPPEDNLLVDSILAASKPLFAHFKNKKGRETYNFWRTDSAYSFPYGGWVKFINRSPEVPDDLDATVISYAALDTPDSTAKKVHALQQQYTNNNTARLKVDNQFYASFSTYSTWYGKNFPVVFDVCVLANVLSFVQLNHLVWTAADLAALQLIVASVQNNDYQTHAFSIAPYYGTTSIILYHLARLMVIKPIAELELIKPTLIATALERFNASNNFLERLMLAIAILKLGGHVPALQVPTTEQLPAVVEKNDYPFFIANIPSYLPKAIRHTMVKLKMGVFYHYCPAFNDALLFEYLVLKGEKKD